MRPLPVGQFLVVDPRPGHGRLRFRGTRVAVETVLKELARGKPRDAILARWPKLTPEALLEAVRLAAEALVAQTPAATQYEKPLGEPVPVGKHLIVHPNVCFGKLTFDGTRLPVTTMLTYLGMGQTIEEILTAWPYLKREALIEALQLATAALSEHYAGAAEASDEPAHSGRAR